MWEVTIPNIAGTGFRVVAACNGFAHFIEKYKACPYTPPRCLAACPTELRLCTEARRMEALNNRRRIPRPETLSAAACLLALLAGGASAAVQEASVPERVTASLEVLYSPEDRPADRLVSLYEGARKSIYLAIYGLTYPPIIKALVAAHKRGVDVRVITDRQKLEDRNQRTGLETLRLAGIPIKVNRHDGLMHIKQAIIDDQINTSGSMNQTSSAARYNDERLDILHDAASTQRAKDKFLKMWTDHSRFEDWR